MASPSKSPLRFTSIVTGVPSGKACGTPSKMNLHRHCNTVLNATEMEG